MNRIALTALAGAVLAVGPIKVSSAADIPAPIYKAPPAAIVATTWTGFYIGAHGGYGWGTATITDVDCYCIASSGFAGFQFPFSDQGWVAGAQLGYNWQSGNLVYGLEADFSFSGIKRNAFLPELIPGSGETYSANIDWFGTVRGRLGWALDRVLPYVTGGFAYAQVENHYNDPLDGNFSTVKDVKVGWTVGGGLDYAIDPNWSIRAEYLFINLEKSAGDFPDGQRFDWDNEFHIVRAALNRRF